MNRIGSQMSEELGREPTDDELAEEVGLSPRTVSQLRAAAVRPTSLNAPINEDDSMEFGELVGDEDARTPFDFLSDRSLRDEPPELLAILDQRERVIIFQRFGLGGARPRTLEEVGKKLGVTSRNSIRKGKKGSVNKS
jgi:RNA polymerase primary sigma factor